MFCSKCGNEISDGAIFCAKCGNKIVDNEVKETEYNTDSIEISSIIEPEISSNVNHTSSKSVKEKKSKKKKLLYIVVILIGLIVLCNTCGGGSEHDDDANVSVDDVVKKVDYVACSDNQGVDVPIIVESVTYGEAFLAGYMDITLDIANTTENDYRDMTFVALAWDREGYPIQFYYTDDPYPYIMECNNLGPKATDQCNWDHPEYYDIGYMAVFLKECTDFEGNTWVNPVMEYVDEHKGEKLETTQLSYFTFE